MILDPTLVKGNVRKKLLANTVIEAYRYDVEEVITQ